jgi:hypothetical protein
MNLERLNKIKNQKLVKQKKYNGEKDMMKKKRLYIEIQILDLKEKIEKLK